MEKGIEIQQQVTKRAAADQHLRLRRIYTGVYVSSFQRFGAFFHDVRPAIHLQEESENLHRSPHPPENPVAGGGNQSVTSDICRDGAQALN